MSIRFLCRVPMKEREMKKTSRWIRILFAATLLAGLASYVFLQHTLADERGVFNYFCEPFTGPWERVMPDGSRIPVEIPGSTEAEPGDDVMIETVIPPELAEYGTLCIRGARQDIRASIDGEEIYYFTTKDTRLLGTSSAALYLMIPIPADAVGKTLTVEYFSNSAYTGHFRSMFYGSQAGILIHVLFRLHGLEIVSGILLMIFSIIILIISTTLRIALKRLPPIFYLALCMFSGSLWILSNSPLQQIVMPNISATADLAFFALMCIAVPLMLYFDELQSGRYHLYYTIYNAISITEIWVTSLLYLFGLAEYTRTYAIMFLTLAIGILLILITIIRDKLKGFSREYAFLAIGYLGLSLCGIYEMTSYIRRDEFFNGAAMGVGFLFLLVMATGQTIRDAIQVEHDRTKARQANKMKAEFLANMSHEIRTPMNAILGINSIILRDTKEPETRENAENIESAGKSLLALVNDILDFSKIESGKITLLPVEYETASLVRDCRNLVSGRAESKGLALEFIVDDSLPVTLKGDVDRVRQIVTNLLTNAVKYTNEGSVTVRFVSDRDDAGDFRLNVSVKDTGIGIKPEDIEKIFGSFQRVDQSRNRSIEGTGLGLSIVHHLTRIMGGDIRVESVPEEGSTFFLSLPQEVVDPTPLRDRKSADTGVKKSVPEESFYAPKASLLVVDDVEMNLKVVTGLLRRSSIRVDTAASGQDCLDMICKEHYDIILLDHMMPEMDGVETFERMKTLPGNLNPDVPVIMLTANALAGSRERYLMAGFTDYLAKPFRYESLVKMLEQYLPPELIEQKPAEE